MKDNRDSKHNRPISKDQDWKLWEFMYFDNLTNQVKQWKI